MDCVSDDDRKEDKEPHEAGVNFWDPDRLRAQAYSPPVHPEKRVDGD